MSFEKIKKNFGFGCMRLKMTDDKVDYPEFSRMIDGYMEAGFNYFDTAHGYLGGQSETALRDCLVSRYDRESFVLTNKLSNLYFKTEQEILPLFEAQLKQCGVAYFDFYLFHALSRKTYDKYKACNCFGTVQQLKAEGKVKHIGMSFHDSADILDKILTEQPCIEVVQLQFNYLDFDDPSVQSKACYDVAVKHGKKVLVMEPVRGGALVNLPEQATKILENYHGSTASFALRFAASFPEVFMVLSGMGTMEMMEDNIQTFTNFIPFSEAEFTVAKQIREIIRKDRQIPCTKCNYCTEACPQGIPVPDLFALYNQVLAAKISRAEFKTALPQDKPSAAECIKCGGCEKACPQNIKIRQHLAKIEKL